MTSTFCDVKDRRVIRGRSELERREKYINQLKALISPFHPALVELVKQCLHNAPEDRPSTEEVLARLQGLREKVEGEYGGPVRLDMVRLRLAKEGKMKDRRLEELTQQQVMCDDCMSLAWQLHGFNDMLYAGDAKS